MAKKRPDLSHETLLWNQGSVFVFGVDEAGRGCLAGPVCAGVSCWAPFSPHPLPPVDVYDSKQMNEREREQAFAPVLALSLASGVGFASAEEIDRWNILRATHLAVARALEGALAELSVRVPSLRPADRALFAFLSDGSHPLVAKASFFTGMEEYAAQLPRLRRLLQQPLRETCVVKGDSKVFSIAAASVLAKVSRDRRMHELHGQLPGYDFESHKGYGTATHLQKLRELGPSAEHRRSFAPVSDALSLFP